MGPGVKPCKLDMQDTAKFGRTNPLVLVSWLRTSSTSPVFAGRMSAVWRLLCLNSRTVVLDPDLQSKMVYYQEWMERLSWPLLLANASCMSFYMDAAAQAEWPRPPRRSRPDVLELAAGWSGGGPEETASIVLAMSQ